MTHKEFLQGLGMEIKVLRIRKGLTQQQVAKMAALNRTALTSMENGKRSSSILSYKRVAESLGTTLKDLCNFAE